MTVEKRDLYGEIAAALANPVLQETVPKATSLIAGLRRQTMERFPGYEAARDAARRIKEEAIERLPELIEQLQASVVRAGGVLHHAADAAEARRVFLKIAEDEGVRSVVKGKSMTSEEVHLNAALQAAGIAVRETDLGEYIVQLANDRPSHIIAPIIHKSVQDVRDAFSRGCDIPMSEVPEKPEQLTQLARVNLRTDFLAADMGITGANFLIADTGTAILVENEGNGRLSSQVPRIHGVIAGIEKIIPTIADLEPFLELLPRSGTGQLLTSYLSFISAPGWKRSPFAAGQGRRQFHVVLLDNGRSEMRDDPTLREALYCVRCGACQNVCAPYQAVGGHVFGGPTYQSGIGVAWEAGVRGLDTAAQFNELCTTCARCKDVCPIRIDIPWMNSVLRQRIAHQEGGFGRAGKLLADPLRLYKLSRRWGSLARGASRMMPLRWLLEKATGLDRRRPLPLPAGPSLSARLVGDGKPVLTDLPAVRGAAKAVREAVNRTRAAAEGAEPSNGAGAAVARSVVFLADCHTDHVEADAGVAAVEVLGHLGYVVTIVSDVCCGRAALSQGDLETARHQARHLQKMIGPLAAAGAPVVGLEPSCMSCVAKDHQRLLEPEEGAKAGLCAAREVLDFLADADSLSSLGGALESAAGAAAGGDEVEPPTIVLHGHCQQKSAGWFPAALRVVAALPGVNVEATRAECCGMAGSFGYKAQTYAASKELGERLIREVRTIETVRPEGISELLACGTSCRNQLADLGGRKPRHPIELIRDALERAR